MKIVLQPDGVSSGKDNFEKTVKRKKKLSDLLEQLPEEEKRKIINQLKNNKVLLNKKLAIWGFKPSKKSIWEKIEPNDTYVAFYREGKFHNLGLIVGKFHSKELAKNLWGEENGQTWEYIYLIDNLRPINVTLEEINKILDTNFPNLRGAIFEEDPNFDNVFGFYVKNDTENFLNIFAKALTSLKFNKQIILQGPPGTGKTYLAKELAEYLISQNLNCDEIKHQLDILWSEFEKVLNGKTFKTFGRGTCFQLKKRDRSAERLAVIINGKDTNLSVYKEKVKKILEESNCNPKNYSSTQKDTDYPYNRVVAEEFLNWLKTKYIKFIQFHPSYTYEDFVRGITIQIKNGVPIYEAKDKIFGKICNEALKNPDKIFVLIIDEINRANLSVVLGELLYALEYRGEPVETPYAVGDSQKQLTEQLIVPPNIYIIGTMNTADRSIGHIDYAIRRRFIFINVKANKDLIVNPKAKKLYENFIEKLFKEENVSPDFRKHIDDIKVGHTYFLATDSEMEEETQIAYKFVYQVIPLLKEYEKDGILFEDKLDEISREIFGKNIDSIDIEDVKKFLRNS